MKRKTYKARVTDRVWEIADIVKLVEDRQKAIDNDAQTASKP